MLVVGVVFLVVDARRRHPVLGPQPARAAGERGLVSAGAPPPPRSIRSATSPSRSAPPRDDARLARRERLQVLVRLEVVHRGRDHRRLLGAVRDLRRAARAPGPVRVEPAQRAGGAERRLLVRHGPARPRRVLAGHRRLARHHDHRAGRDAARHRPRHRARARHRLLPRRGRRHPQPPHRDGPRAAGRARRPCWRIVSLGPSNLTIILVVGFVFAPVIARTVRAAVLQRARARVRRRGAIAQRAARPTSCSPRSCPT